MNFGCECSDALVILGRSVVFLPEPPPHIAMSTKKPSSTNGKAPHEPAAKPGEPDRRYKDPTTAPKKISDHRMTFFVPTEIHLQLKRLSAIGAMADVDGTLNVDVQPSGLARLALQHLFSSVFADYPSDGAKEVEAQVGRLIDACNRQTTLAAKASFGASK